MPKLSPQFDRLSHRLPDGAAAILRFGARGYAKTGLIALMISASLNLAAQESAVKPGTESGSLETGAQTRAVKEAQGAGIDEALAAEFAAADKDNRRAAQLYLQAATKNKRADFAERAARLALSERDFALTEEAAQRWLTLAPKDLNAMQALAFAQIAQGNKRQSAESVRKLLLNEDPKAAGLVLAMFAAPDARALAVELLEQFKEDPAFKKVPVERGLVPLALRLKQDELALSLAKQATDADPKNAKAWVLRALSELANKAPERAATAYQRAVDLDPSNVRMRLGYVQVLNDLRRFDQLDATLKAAPNPGAELFQARLAFALNRYPPPASGGGKKINRKLDRELKQLASAIEKAEKLELGAKQMLLGQTAELRGNDKAALAFYNAIGEGDGYAAAQIRVAMIQSRSNLGLARKTAQALQQNRDEQVRIDAYLLESELLKDAGKADESFAVLTSGTDAEPESTELLYARAMAAFDGDDLEALEGDLTRVLAINPNHADALNALGYGLLEKTKRWEEAMELIQRANAIQPGSGAILDSLGWAHFKLGRYDQAIVSLRAAYLATPAGEIASHLGEALHALGAEDEAQQAWQTGLDDFPGDASILKTLERLKVVLKK